MIPYHNSSPPWEEEDGVNNGQEDHAEEDIGVPEGNYGKEDQVAGNTTEHEYDHFDCILV